MPSSQAASADAERLLARHLAAFSGVTVLVLGDAMLDRYVHGDVRRISPEAPIPVLRARTRRFVLGGAGNVAENAVALGARALLVGLIGDDAAGQELSATLQGRIGNGLEFFQGIVNRDNFKKMSQVVLILNLVQVISSRCCVAHQLRSMTSLFAGVCQYGISLQQPAVPGGV